MNREQSLKSENKKIRQIFFELDEILGIENDSITTIENFISSLDIQTNLSYLNIDIINELNNIKLMVNSERFNNNPFKISIDAIFNQ